MAKINFPEKVTATQIKLALFQYFLFKRYARLVVAEVSFHGSGIADFAAQLNGAIIEVEIKISKGDLRCEAKSKYRKHEIYSWDETRDSRWVLVPNKYYICVPENLVDEARGFVEKNNPKYGILRYKKSNIGDPGIKVVRQGKLLRKVLNEKLCEILIRRNAVEQANYYKLKVEQEKRKLQMRVGKMLNVAKYPAIVANILSVIMLSAIMLYELVVRN